MGPWSRLERRLAGKNARPTRRRNVESPEGGGGCRRRRSAAFLAKALHQRARRLQIFLPRRIARIQLSQPLRDSQSLICMRPRASGIILPEEDVGEHPIAIEQIPLPLRVPRILPRQARPQQGRFPVTGRRNVESPVGSLTLDYLCGVLCSLPRFDRIGA